MLPILLQGWKKAAASSPTARKVTGGLRVAAWLSVVGIIGLVAVGRSARADVKSSSLSFGRELNQLIDQDGTTDSIHLKLNGQSIHLRQDIQTKTVHEVIAEYESFCLKNPSAFNELWAKAPFSVPEMPTPNNLPPGLEAGVVKAEADTEGMLICITKGSKSKKGIMEALTGFDETQDLGAIGRLRYVYVKQAGQAGRSKVMAVWTDDSFNIGQIALEDGSEAPGVDTQLPRPEGARRVVNAEVVGTPYGVRVYEVKQTKEEVAAFYDSWAKSHDFRSIGGEVDPSQKLRGYFRGGSQVMIGVYTNPDGKTYASISELWPKNGNVAQKEIP
jgi:hypothetical protein